MVNSQQPRVHTALVLGSRHMDAGDVRVRLHGIGPQGAKPRGGVVLVTLAAIGDRQVSSKSIHEKQR